MIRFGARGLAIVLATTATACTPTLPPSPVAVSTTASPFAPAATATPAPSATPEPTIDPQPIPTSTLEGWWGSDASFGFCGTLLARYRIGLKIDAIGPCLGVLFDPGKAIKLASGQDLDLHMTVRRAGAAPIYPLPTSTDPLVIQPWYIADTATMTYRALLPGTARLMTEGACLVKDDSPTGVHGLDGPCPVAEITVGSMTMDCAEVPLDLCRAAAAAAILGPVELQGDLLGFEAHAASGIPWPGCGRTAVEVTLLSSKLDSDYTVTIGQLEPDNLEPRNFAVCTY